MRERIEEIVSNCQGKIGIIIKYSDGRKIEINKDIIFPSASLIKLFIAFAIEKNLYNKKVTIKESEKVQGCGVLKNLNSNLEISVRDLIVLMLAFSDNTATNILIDLIGQDKINQKFQKVGFKDTFLGRKMMDTLAKKRGEDNYTTPQEVEKVLDILCQDKEIVDILKKQGYNNKLNLYFTREEGLEFAHKTGELKGVEHDAGRIYFEEEWIDIIVMTKELLHNGDGIKVNNLIGEEVIGELIKKRREDEVFKITSSRE